MWMCTIAKFSKTCWKFWSHYTLLLQNRYKNWHYKDSLLCDTNLDFSSSHRRADQLVSPICKSHNFGPLLHCTLSGIRLELHFGWWSNNKADLTWRLWMTGWLGTQKQIMLKLLHQSQITQHQTQFLLASTPYRYSLSYYQYQGRQNILWTVTRFGLHRIWWRSWSNPCQPLPCLFHQTRLTNSLLRLSNRLPGKLPVLTENLSTAVDAEKKRWHTIQPAPRISSTLTTF